MNLAAAIISTITPDIFMGLDTARTSNTRSVAPTQSSSGRTIPHQTLPNRSGVTQPVMPRTLPAQSIDSVRTSTVRQIAIPQNNPITPPTTPTTQPVSDAIAQIVQTPFGVLSDLMANMFGASQGISPVQSPSVVPVPVGGESGGGNTLLILIVLGLGGFAVWYFYFRK